MAAPTHLATGDVRGRPFGGGPDLPALARLLAACPGENADDTLRRLQAPRHLERVRQGTEASRVWLSSAEPGAGAAEARFLACAVVGSPNGTFHIHPAARRESVETAVMGWIHRQLPRVVAAHPEFGRLDIHLRPETDSYRAGLLERHGFTRVETVTRRMRRPLDPPPPDAVLPPGYRVRPLGGPDELERYAAVFGEVFGAGPSVESLRERWQQPGHLPELVVEAQDGAFVAFCACEIGHSPQMPLAPDEGCVSHVGTARAHRRRGLGRAALRAGLWQLRERGVRWAVMQTGGANEASQRLFESEGFATCEMVPRLRYVRRAAATDA